MRELLDRLIDDFHERSLPDLVPRSQKMHWVPGKANVVVGMRRAGKTWFCFQTMKELLSRKVRKERLLYLNFEDERLLPFSTSDFDLILEIYFKKHPALKKVSCYLFLDEVQRIPGWELFVRRILDTERMFVCVTGSSSRFLSAEIATSLRGRSLTTEVFPFSFGEFLRFRGHKVHNKKRFGSALRAALQNSFEMYLSRGGFPEVLRLNADLHRQVLQNYLDVVLLRDVIERYAVSNTQAVRALMRDVLSAPAARFSVNKFYNTLRSLGIACSKTDLYNFVDYLLDAYLLYRVPIHTRSERVRRVNPGKMYAVDTGLLNAVSSRITPDSGALLENLVFLHLRRKGLDPRYYMTAEGTEVDFLVWDGDKRSGQLIQVCWDITDQETRNREVSALQIAMKELNIASSTIVTWMDEERLGGNVFAIPAWRWLLD